MKTTLILFSLVVAAAVAAASFLLLVYHARGFQIRVVDIVFVGAFSCSIAGLFGLPLLVMLSSLRVKPERSSCAIAGAVLGSLPGIFTWLFGESAPFANVFTAPGVTSGVLGGMIFFVLVKSLKLD
jgi:hypothetical protein